MAITSLYSPYSRLDAKSRHILQLFAISDEILNRQGLAELSSKAGWTDTDGKRLAKTAIGPILKKLLKQQLIVEASYGSAQVDPNIQDWVIQDLVRSDWFSALSDAVVSRSSSGYYRRDQPERDLRIAFYQGKVDAFRARRRGNGGIKS